MSKNNDVEKGDLRRCIASECESSGNTFCKEGTERLWLLQNNRQQQ